MNTPMGQIIAQSPWAIICKCSLEVGGNRSNLWMLVTVIFIISNNEPMWQPELVLSHFSQHKSKVGRHFNDFIFETSIMGKKFNNTILVMWISEECWPLIKDQSQWSLSKLLSRNCCCCWDANPRKETWSEGISIQSPPTPTGWDDTNLFMRVFWRKATLVRVSNMVSVEPLAFVMSL